MHIINPITTVLLDREEFESKEYQGYPFKYILEADGNIIYNTSLTAGRHVFTKETSLQGSDVPFEDDIQPLAFGNKIPGPFFFQIKKFFLDVIDMGPGTYEAQVFIVWNLEDEEYRIVIPDQTVGSTHLNWDLNEILSECDIVICDIHSHNDMPAFFSGVDNRDDKKNPWISGVFGHLSSDDMKYVFRFNDGAGRNFELSSRDIFQFEDEVTTPDDWIGHVKLDVTSYSTPRRSLLTDISRYTGKYMPDDTELFDLMSIEEEAVHDDIVDILSELPHNECIEVLQAMQSFLSDTEGTTLIHEDSSAFSQISSLLTDDVEDDPTRLRILSELLTEYGVY